MPWPTPQDYNEAIQNPRSSFEDPDLRTGMPELTPLGLPRPITGNFASVYRVHCAGKDWAVRCFWREFDDLQQRYAAISAHLQSAQLPYTVGFQYLPRGIKVRGQWYPILKMEWVEGELLNEYVEQHLHDPAALRRLADRWRDMVRALERASLAHGDLQHGNVLVKNGELKLVDYDGMYVPALSGKGSHELGHHHYQHPLRSGLDFGIGMDRFSAWTIYLSLVSVAAEPALWTTALAGDECLLLRKSDYDYLASSSILALLERHADPEVRRLTELFAMALRRPPMQVPALDLPPVAVASCPLTAAGPVIYSGWCLRTAWQILVPSVSSPLSLAPVLPGPASGVPGWVIDHLQAEARAESARLTGSLLPPRCAGTATVCAAIGLLAAVWVTHMPVMAVILLFIGLLVLNLAVLIVAFRHDPAVARMNTLLQQQRRELRGLQAEGRKMRALEAAKERGAARLARSISQADDRRAAWRQNEQQALAVAAARRDRELGSIAEELHRLEEEQRVELERALHALQEQHVRDCLRHRTLRAASIPGIGWPAKARLWTVGVWAASDVTSERAVALRALGDEVQLALIGWRVEVEREARRTMPKTLPAATVHPLERRYAQRKDALDARARQARDDNSSHRAEIQRRYQDRSDALQHDITEARREWAERVGELDARLAEHLAARAPYLVRLADLERDASRFREVTLARYARLAYLSWMPQE